jgi:hypothetical protein
VAPSGAGRRIPRRSHARRVIPAHAQRNLKLQDNGFTRLQSRCEAQRRTRRIAKVFTWVCRGNNILSHPHLTPTPPLTLTASLPPTSSSSWPQLPTILSPHVPYSPLPRPPHPHRQLCCHPRPRNGGYCVILACTSPLASVCPATESAPQTPFRLAPPTTSRLALSTLHTVGELSSNGLSVMTALHELGAVLGAFLSGFIAARYSRKMSIGRLASRSAEPSQCLARYGS